MSIFYAVGVGSGNPLEMTIQAKQILEQVDVIIIPVTEKNANSIAFAIAAQVADMQHAEKLKIIFPMQKNLDYKNYLTSGVLLPVTKRLDMGKNIAMITLGDVSVYSTANYVRQIISEQGYQTEVISGISSFSSGSAKAQLSLCENQENLLILPAVNSPEIVKKALLQADNIIIMKAGKALTWLIPMLKELNLFDKTIMFCDLNMPGEYIGVPVETQSYFVILLIKKGGLY
ncbi:MAG: precorrin-2 C(20)-methyltransferase [Oscillospiraceae bacterium]|nr:precorrin-2 C(20)-methyltransferase [Oscillospiraceae bacterium]